MVNGTFDVLYHNGNSVGARVQYQTKTSGVSSGSRRLYDGSSLPKQAGKVAGECIIDEPRKKTGTRHSIWRIVAKHYNDTSS